MRAKPAPSPYHVTARQHDLLRQLAATHTHVTSLSHSMVRASCRNAESTASQLTYFLIERARLMATLAAL